MGCVLYKEGRILRKSAVNKPAMRRLACRAGVKRMSGWVYEETRGWMWLHMQSMLRDVVLHTTHDHRTTVTAKDVVRALRRSGRNLYGFAG
ncbi:Histone H4 [Mycena sanguinolenta]|uniref:Histone H4 n=1 Tax=Mycena sanguinolenta TaxID=230812 RepID=A0A8H6ZEJ7_9AGAR|nr:Histone H4 [Mycena sanguinolenta]